MPRRRLPQRRPGPSPTQRARRSSENGRGSSKGGVGPLGELDWTAIVRGVVLVGVVAGVAAFLFYPDISRLLERWQNASRDSTHNEAEPREVRSDPHELHDGESNGRRKAGEDRSEKTAKSTKSPPLRAVKNGGQGRGKSSERSNGGRGQTGEGHRDSRDAVVTERSGVSGDLMEEEEEEEDAMEVELMEEEEPTVFVDIGGEEEEEEELDEETQLPVDVPRTRDAGENQGGRDVGRGGGEEPIVLTDGQPITFTPVGSADDSIIRLGGRPKETKPKAPSDENHKTDKTKSVSPNSSRNKASKTKEQHSSKSDHSHRNSPDTSANKSAESSGSKKSSSKKTKNQKKTDKNEKRQPSSGSKDQTPDDLPEEVRNFRPTYLRTVTAKKIFADGRRIPPVELIPQKETNSSVRVFLFNEFLSEAECDGLRRVHDKHVQDTSLPPLLCFDSLTTLRKHLQEVNRNVKVTPNDFIKGTRCVNATFSKTLSNWLYGNWSYSTAFYPGESRFSTIFEARVQQAMGLDPRNGGKFQITSYPTGKAYKAHTDCVLDGTDERDRVATVLVYLDDVDDGGETKFPELGIWVKPRKGRALVWNNMSPEGRCEPHSLHVASKVNSGSKYILIRWYYYKSFYSLGKRPPEPSLPVRAEGTPRVSCDDYDNGSCRWYDEWNNDHLLEYELQKYTLI